jgi:flagellar hook-basal body complex protein FliE
MNMSPVSPVNSPGLTAGMLQLNGLNEAALASGAAAPAKAAASASETFQQYLATAMDQTVQLQHAADKSSEAFLTGQTDDIHKVMIATEKAGLAFQLTMQVRNKIVEAYQEVMRMQI